MVRQWSKLYGNRVDDVNNWCAISTGNEELVRQNTIVHKISFTALDNLTIIMNNGEELPLASGDTVGIDNADTYSIMSWKIKEANKKYRFWFGYREK